MIARIALVAAAAFNGIVALAQAQHPGTAIPKTVTPRQARVRVQGAQ
jgi:hypothetical protein